MQIFKDYKKYKQYEPEYEKWKNNIEQTEIKRKQYIKQHGLKMSREDLERTKTFLNAVDIMDEYSQSNAESMENVSEMMQNSLKSYAVQAGIILGALSWRLPALQKVFNKFAEKYPRASLGLIALPPVIGALAGIIAAVPLTVWAASKQIGASQKGRFEAMRKDLFNPALFAILTLEQEKQAKKTAADIPIDEDMKKSSDARLGKSSEIKSSFKQFLSLFKKDKEYEKQKKEFDEKLKEHESRFNEPLSAEDIERAEKDKQLIAKVVEKMDYASQEYAEQTELATNTFKAFALAGGGVSGWLSSKLLKLIKTANPAVKQFLPIVIGLITASILTILPAKLQKQASRIGRFQVRKELLNNPDELIYIDENKLPKGEVKIPEKKKENFLKYLFRIVKENKEYNDYVKKEGIKQLQRQKAVEKIKLSDKQLKDAKTLQMNIFKTFNRVDGKSQQYAESVEAAGEIIKEVLQPVLAFTGPALGALWAEKDFSKILKAGADAPLSAANKPLFKFISGILLTGFLPIIALDTVFTKKQIKASRIADMLALKELDDYRHYVDYDNLSPADKGAQNTSAVKNAAGQSSSNLLELYSSRKTA